jgi:hypothetical protein
MSKTTGSKVSNVDGMTIATVRKQLDNLRKQWDKKNQEPFFLCNILPSDQSVATFATKYVLGQRNARSQTNKNAKIQNSGNVQKKVQEL